MKLTVISTILGYGKMLQDSGTTITYLAQKDRKIKQISLLTWKKNGEYDNIFQGPLRIEEIYNEKRPTSSFKYFLALHKSDSDFYLFNLMPTAYGNNNLSNLIGLLLPVYTSKILKARTAILYHNSTFTNDVKKLGYSGLFNLIRFKILRLIETLIFSNVNTFFLTKTYADLVQREIPKAKVHNINLSFFGIGTLILNNLNEKENIVLRSGDKARILMFGSWGPQKNPTQALLALRQLRSQNIAFELTVAGGINEHFVDQKKYYDDLFLQFSDIVDHRINYVEEGNLLTLFSNSDLVVIPYNTPGGFSGVLSMAMFFKKYIIISDFPEYKEQASDYKDIFFYGNNTDDLYEKIKIFLLEKFIPDYTNIIKIKDEIDKMIDEFEIFFHYD